MLGVSSSRRFSSERNGWLSLMRVYFVRLSSDDFRSKKVISGETIKRVTKHELRTRTQRGKEFEDRVNPASANRPSILE